jgi:CubicO group peptidase (beta-lactamase class C family)
VAGGPIKGCPPRQAIRHNGVKTVKVAFGIAIAASLCLLPAASASAAGPCPGSEIPTASGCTSFAAAGRQVDAIVERAAQDNDLRAALVRIDVRDRTLTRVATGESIAGEPASLRMHFRIGSIAIPYLIDLLLQLEDEGELSLDDPVSNWLPGLPNADRVTLRMLANSTSGYPDWIQGNPAFVDALLADVFRQWKTQELVDTAFSQPLICDPGTCFHYAHTNFVIIDRVIREITDRPVRSLMRERILGPLGVRETKISAFPGIEAPVLHSYSSDRGPYEDSTFWSPSWTIAKSTIMTSTIGDLIKAAKALGTGALISRRASRERFAPTTVGLGPFSADFYYGLGVVVANSWRIQNPDLNGYTAIAGYLPSRKVSLALTVTNGQGAATTGVNNSQKLFESITEYLTPDHPGAPPIG